MIRTRSCIVRELVSRQIFLGVTATLLRFIQTSNKLTCTHYVQYSKLHLCSKLFTQCPKSRVNTLFQGLGRKYVQNAFNGLVENLLFERLPVCLGQCSRIINHGQMSLTIVIIREHVRRGPIICNCQLCHMHSLIQVIFLAMNHYHL